MARILFMHTNFPAQFRGLAGSLIAAGHACAAISSSTGRAEPGTRLLQWRTRRGSTPGLFPPATRSEADLLRGEAAARAALELKESGFVPDLIIGHPGWGETLFVGEIFPAARQILYGEYYYRTQGGDVGFDPEFGPLAFDERIRVHAKNATGALAYAEADRIVCPTPFQASLLPEMFRERVGIIHEGVDTDLIRPRAPGALRLPEGRALDPQRPLVTFANRRFEPLRGFHVFMRALPSFLARVPEAEVVLIGADHPNVYGKRPDSGSWKETMLRELGGRLDLRRLHFTGPLRHPDMLAFMSAARAHVYLTYPFTLSWSMLEAMALGCLVIASDTAPVCDVIEDGRNGVLTDIFDPAALGDRLVEACTRPRSHFDAIRQAARETIVARYDRDRVCRPAWTRLIADVLGTGAKGAG